MFPQAHRLARPPAQGGRPRDFGFLAQTHREMNKLQSDTRRQYRNYTKFISRSPKGPPPSSWAQGTGRWARMEQGAREALRSWVHGTLCAPRQTPCPLWVVHSPLLHHRQGIKVWPLGVGAAGRKQRTGWGRREFWSPSPHLLHHAGARRLTHDPWAPIHT